MHGQFAPPDWRDFYADRRKAAASTTPRLHEVPKDRVQAPATILAREVPRGVIRPVRALATATVLLSSGVLLGNIAQALLLLPLPGALLATARDGAALPGTPMLDLVGALTGVLTLATFVVAGLWLGRARENALVISPAAPHARSAAWGWLGWFVPVVQWWFPYQVVRDVARASARSRSGGAVPVGAWWGAWLAMSAGGALLGAALEVSVVVPALEGLFPFAVAASVLVAVTAFALWARVVARITDLQENARHVVVLPDTAAYALSRLSRR